MEDKYIKIPKKYHNLFAVSIDNMRVELVEDINGHKYVPERCLNWIDFLNKFDKNLDKKEELLPLYEYASKSEAVEIELKKEEETI
tara:strand:+ start:965 stop:1222 length:258 start_codon:yes stop_codon:yes gene_type:complete